MDAAFPHTMDSTTVQKHAYFIFIIMMQTLKILIKQLANTYVQYRHFVLQLCFLLGWKPLLVNHFDSDFTTCLLTSCCNCLQKHHSSPKIQNANQNTQAVGGRPPRCAPPRPATEARSGSLEPGRLSWA